MLSETERAEVMAVLRRSPLIAQWPEFERNPPPNLAIRTYAQGDSIYKPGDAPSYLFVLLSGQVVQLAELEDHTPWFQRMIRPGEFFGQHALFSYEYRTSTQVAADSARVLLMPASAVRLAMEHDAGLREVLLLETLSMRMRRFPVLRALTDDDVRWLALVAADVTLAAGTPVPLNEKPGLWLVDRGQVLVKGPANPYPQVADRWRLTSGNFFVAPRTDPEAETRGLVIMDGLRYGANCVADSAEAHLMSQLIYLPLEHTARLVEHVRGVAEVLRAPLDIVPVLASLPLLDGLKDEHLYHLAQFVAWEFVPAGQNITTQGHVGHSYVILRAGAAAVVAYDEQGRERPRNKLFPITAYGETSLLEGKARDATVRSVRGTDINGADLLILDRRDLRHAFGEDPALWTPEVGLVSRSLKEKTPQKQLSWMEEGEVLLVQDRPHWFWLAFPLFVVVLVFFLLLMLANLVPAAVQPVADAVLLLFAAILFAIALFIIVNYFDDYYAVTNRRAIRRDRLLLVYESRQEALGGMIQDVTVATDFWGRIFNFGDVTIRTASKQSAVRFTNVPDPYKVMEHVQATRVQTRAAVRGRQREEVRRGLISGLQLALPIPERARALGNVTEPVKAPSWLGRIFRARPDDPLPVPRPRSPRGILKVLTRPLPESLRGTLLGPEPKRAQLSRPLVWRKHWLNLVGRAWLPFLLLIIIGLLGVGGILVQLDQFGITPVQFVLAWLVLGAPVLFWLWWQYEDWKNDVYIVTDDRIIDVEMKPLSLNVKQREGGLDRIQNVTTQQRGVWAAVFGYGDVVITTAAANEGFTFNMVPNAKQVQAAIFQRVDTFRARQEEKRSAERQRELIEGLEVYHRLRGSPEVPPEWREA
jgi:CRP-like cAMP-binding protein/uncharacterized membrane protein YdbT with pleckstrin-like domain